MKKIFLQLLALFLAAQTVAAQDSLAVKKQTFDQAFDYFGAEFMKAYILHNLNTPGAKVSTQDKDGWKNAIEPVLSANSLSQPVSPDKLKSLLSGPNGWKWSGDNVYPALLKARDAYKPGWGKKEMMSFFKEDINKTKVTATALLGKFKEGNQAYLKEIDGFLATALSPAQGEEAAQAASADTATASAGDTAAKAATDTTAANPQPASGAATGSSGMEMLLFIPVAIALALLGFKVMQQAGTISRMEIQMNKLISKANGTSPDGNSVADLKEEYAKRLNKLDESLAKIQDKLAGITQKPGPASFEQPDKTYGSAPTVGDAPSANFPPHFYMPAPDKDGNFSASDASPSIYVTKTIFKFTPLNTDATEVSVEIVQHEQVFQTFFNTPSVYLPACEALNSNHGKDAKKITTVEKGRALKQGGVWVIKKPVKIKYE